MAAADGGVGVRIDEEDADGSFYLQKFRLYETRSTFYMIGRDKTRTYWKVLKIDRLNPTELNIWEDPTTYSKNECQDLLKMIHEGNRSTGGLKFINNCYGIIGFIKFLGPYYMLIITKRRQIGSICGHNVYAVSKSEMIALSCSTTPLDTANSKSENRYKKLLCTVDLTKDFFFSYSYHVMHSLQKNLSDSQNGLATYETMFVWNGFLTRGIRNLLKNTLWTVALVHGFFKQDTLKISEKEFKLTLIARRSRYYAGTRYRKRGVNEKGRVANDVETEQIVSEDVPGACSTQLTAVVQHRGSIPLFWSQETSRLNIRPDIILQKKDQHYEATKLHFENLVKRYGNPIIIFNLIKKREKKPRESILHSEFANAIDFINKDLSDENRLKFVHWDLHKLSRRKATNVLLLLARVAAYALTLTDLFYCQLTPPLGLEGSLNWPFLEKEADIEWPSMNCKRGAEDSQNEVKEDDSKSSSYCFAKPCRLQSGVLRTNCIDCLDRTNVSQFAYGLAAFGHQLHALGLIAVPKIDLDAPLAEELMRLYEAMGDTLALQYGGSGAHNKIFSERRGQWKAATQSQEFFRTLQRYYSNAYMDAEKQDAINVFLGYFQPQQGKPALWELDSDQYYNIGRLSSFSEEIPRSSFKRSLSEGNILSECKNAITGTDGGHELMNPELPEAMHQGGDAEGLPDMTTEISNVWGTSSSRYTPKMAQRQSFADSDHIYFNELGACGSNCSNFLDLDWLSSSANSCEDETFERVSPRSLPTETVSNGRTGETPALSENESIWRVRKATERELQSSSPEYSEVFMHWINHGEIFCH